MSAPTALRLAPSAASTTRQLAPPTPWRPGGLRDSVRGGMATKVYVDAFNLYYGCLKSASAGGQVSERTRQLQVRPLLSLVYGPCRYGTRTSQPPLRRSGCGPSTRDKVSEMKSPTGFFGSPVYSKTSTKVAGPALRLKVGPPVIENFSNRPT